MGARKGKGETERTGKWESRRERVNFEEQASISLAMDFVNFKCECIL